MENSMRCSMRWKRNLVVLLAAAFLLFLGSAFAEDDYPAAFRDMEWKAGMDLWGFPVRDDTSFVAWCLNARNGFAFHSNFQLRADGQTADTSPWGSAKDWGYHAQELGYLVDKNPEVGSIYWSGDGESGHVAWVSAVEGDHVFIEQYNFPMLNEWRNGEYSLMDFYLGDVNYANVYFIHFKDMEPGATQEFQVHVFSEDMPYEPQVPFILRAEVFGGVPPFNVKWTIREKTENSHTALYDALSREPDRIQEISYTTDSWMIRDAYSAPAQGGDLVFSLEITDVQGRNYRNEAAVTGTSELQWAIEYRSFVLENGYAAYETVDQNGNEVRFYPEEIAGVQNLSPVAFALYDMDRNGIPELLAYNGKANDAGEIYAFTFRDNQFHFAGTVGFGGCDLFFYDDVTYSGLFCIDGDEAVEHASYFKLENGQILREDLASFNHYPNGETRWSYYPEVTMLTSDHALYNLYEAGKKFWLRLDPVWTIRGKDWFNEFLTDTFALTEEEHTERIAQKEAGNLMMEEVLPPQAAATPEPEETVAKETAKPLVIFSLGDYVDPNPSVVRRRTLNAYSGPGTNYIRGAGGKASVSTNGRIYVYGKENDWVLIQYDVSNNHWRFAYIRQNAFITPENIPPLTFAYRTMKMARDAEMTDDPFFSRAKLKSVRAGKQVVYLATYDVWAYIEYNAARGFVPVDSLVWEENSTR